MDHAAKAREALAMADNSDNEDAPVQAVIAIGHALLDVADAIREQTADAKWGGIRDDLENINDALRNTIGGRS